MAEEEQTVFSKVRIEGGVLEPIMDIVLEKEGYKYRYTARAIDSDKGSDWIKETTYYLKPDSESSQTDTLYGQARTNYIMGDIYDRHYDLETLPDGTKYQLEPSEDSDDSSKMTLILTVPTSKS